MGKFKERMDGGWTYVYQAPDSKKVMPLYFDANRKSEINFLNKKFYLFPVHSETGMNLQWEIKKNGNLGKSLSIKCQWDLTHSRSLKVLFISLTGTTYEEVGCFADKYNRGRRKRPIEGPITFYNPPETAVEKCFKRAMAALNSHFAVQNNNECFTARNAGQTYNSHDPHGTANGCRNGRGGPGFNAVYRIKGM